MAVCGMRCVDLKNDILKMLGTHFSYSKKTENGKKLLHNCNKYSASTENMEDEKKWKILH